MSSFRQLMMRKKGNYIDLNIIGNLTINNGIVSGFSPSDYLQLANAFPVDGNSWEIKIAFTITQLGKVNPIIGSANNSIYRGIEVLTNEGNTVNFRLRSQESPNSWGIVDAGGLSPALNANQQYYAWITYNGTNTYTLKISTNNINWTTYKKVNSSYKLYSGTFALGYDSYWNQFYGNIDLNQSYIVINGTQYNFRLNSERYIAVKKVGSPTVNDGIISNTTSSNYVKFNSSTNTIDNWEMSIDFIFPQTQSAYNGLISRANPGFQIFTKTGENYCWIEINGVDAIMVFPNLIRGGNYNINIKYNSGHWTAILTNKNNETSQTLTATTSNEWFLSGEFRLGLTQSGNYGWDGSIDLNNSYIKIDGTKYNFKIV